MNLHNFYKNRVLSICSVLLCFFSCNCSKNTTVNSDISYTIAHGYFVRNDININDIPNKITKQKDFERYFGYAAIMGTNGKPTNINFDKNDVIPIVWQATDTLTEVKVQSINKQEETIVIEVEIQQKQKITFTIQPHCLIVLPKENGDNIQKKITIVQQ